MRSPFIDMCADLARQTHAKKAPPKRVLVLGRPKLVYIREQGEDRRRIH